MRHRAILALLTILPGPATAAEMIVVRESDCRYLIRHEAAPDVAHTPGRDVRGRAVVPADLPGSAALSLP